MKMIIAQKIGMTRIFDKDNVSVPVSVLKAGPCKVRVIDDNHAEVEFKNKTNSKKSSKIVKQFKTNKEEISQIKDKKEITVKDFNINDKVDVTGVSKGKGFAGVMKRHGFGGMPASHGHEKQRIPGSIGCGYPERVIKGKKMAGHMGNAQITVKNLKIVDIDEENNIIALKGATPSYAGKILFIKSK